MPASSRTELQTFSLSVEFSSGGEPFATENYNIDAPDWYRAEREALEMSISSPYDNIRIPALTRQVIAR